ncbi:recombinase family protein [Oryzobacter sp. R7]|uniref:recombinase family protein n=1 Tax=Oryzobacter faecalis TaxID=3388656 RepID=UPI00398C835A
MRAGVYARVSEDQRGEGRSVAEQVAECRAWADREGWTVVDVIEETGSASRFARGARARARWDDVVALVRSGSIDVLLTWEHSRATRQLSEYSDLAAVCSAAGVLWGYSGTVYDLTKREDRFRTGLDALLAEDESARTSERVSRAVRARAAQGAPHGKLPYGYRREYDPATGALVRQVPDEETAPVVREIVQRVADGETLMAVAADLTRRGVPIPRPARGRDLDQAWIPMTVRRIAASPTYAGRRIHRGVDVGPAAWDPIVDTALHERALAALDEIASRRRPNPDRKVKHLLSGIARCARCDTRMHAQKNRSSMAYTCETFCTTRRMDRVDDVVVQRLLELLVAVRDGKVVVDVTPALAEARADVDALHARLASFIDQAADGDLTAASLARVEARLRPKIEEAERRARALAKEPVLARYDLSDPDALWSRLGILERRDLLARTVAITIHPVGKGNRVFDPRAIEVRPTW